MGRWCCLYDGDGMSMMMMEVIVLVTVMMWWCFMLVCPTPDKSSGGRNSVYREVNVLE
jgi:hypothetical protein